MPVPESADEAEYIWTDTVILEDDEGTFPIQGIIGLGKVKVYLVEWLAAAEGKLRLKFCLQTGCTSTASWEKTVKVIMESDAVHETLVDDGRDELPQGFK